MATETLKNDRKLDAFFPGWQALIQEDRLISRLAVMESQLQVQAKISQSCAGKDGTTPTLDENIRQVWVWWLQF
jgi:hypothetical protein